MKQFIITLRTGLFAFFCVVGSVTTLHAQASLPGQPKTVADAAVWVGQILADQTAQEPQGYFTGFGVCPSGAEWKNGNGFGCTFSLPNFTGPVSVWWSTQQQEYAGEAISVKSTGITLPVVPNVIETLDDGTRIIEIWSGEKVFLPKGRSLCADISIGLDLGLFIDKPTFGFGSLPPQSISQSMCWAGDGVATELFPVNG